MKRFTLFLIEVYQKIFSVILKNILGTSHFCRFKPTCSEYAKTAVKEKGVLVGSLMAFSRILKCQPLYKHSL